MDSESGHAEDGSLVPAVDFDYAAVDAKLFGAEPEDLSQFTEEDVDRALAVLNILLRWIFQNGMKNPEGITLRAICICWIFLKELRPMQLSELARGFGKKKQSLGRCVDLFKISFPHIKTAHMRPLKNE